MACQRKSNDCYCCDEEYRKPDVSGPFGSCFVRVDVNVRQLVSDPFMSISGAVKLGLHKRAPGISGSGTPLFGQHIVIEACRPE